MDKYLITYNYLKNENKKLKEKENNFTTYNYIKIKINDFIYNNIIYCYEYQQTNPSLPVQRTKSNPKKT